MQRKTSERGGIVTCDRIDVGGNVCRGVKSEDVLDMYFCRKRRNTTKT